jgi:predicted lactoylglutathione lyase
MTSIFVNIPTNDLERSVAFYRALGCAINPNFTDENAACVVWSDDIFFMVLRREFFATFTEKPVGGKEWAQVSLSFAQDSRADVDAIVEAGLAAGGTEPHPLRTTASCTAATWTTPATASASSTWTPSRPSRSSGGGRVMRGGPGHQIIGRSSSSGPSRSRSTTTGT